MPAGHVGRGTNNTALLNDPYYVGLRQRRLRGAEYDALVDEFIRAACETFPGVLIQFEDFANHNAFRLLRKYRDTVCTFNDDIQGTATVALAGIFTALRVTGGKLVNQKILFLGAGEAATGIADLVVSAMVAVGCSKAEACSEIGWWTSRFGGQEPHRSRRAQNSLRARSQADQRFPVCHRTLKPTAIIGVAAVGGTFTAEVLQAMAQLNARPIIFVL